MLVPPWKGGLEMISRRLTTALALLGTSIPIADLPGIGACSRIGAARASERSFWSAVILRTGTPLAGSSSYWVTLAPELTPRTRAATPKLARVFSIRSML
jgi:hypothetical protein